MDDAPARRRYAAASSVVRYGDRVPIDGVSVLVAVTLSAARLGKTSGMLCALSGLVARAPRARSSVHLVLFAAPEISFGVTRRRVLLASARKVATTVQQPPNSFDLARGAVRLDDYVGAPPTGAAARQALRAGGATPLLGARGADNLTAQ